MIFDWWAAHKRDLPWRRTRDPYRIMVSEVMLQQTQVSRVLPKYAEFLKVFQTVVDLAKATPAAVLRVWKGMGYNRRALYLQKAAKVIVEQHNGKLPISEQLLSALPGLGTYTARAILVFAYKKEAPMVDTNVRQIITHFFFDDKPQKPSVIENVARQLVPPGKSWEWHQALMDYGALALPALTHQRIHASRRNGVPFRDSNRFFRGRIIDRLREGAMQERVLVTQMAVSYGKSKTFMAGIIDSLVKDGLIERASRGMLQLPGE